MINLYSTPIYNEIYLKCKIYLIITKSIPVWMKLYLVPQSLYSDLSLPIGCIMLRTIRTLGHNALVQLSSFPEANIILCADLEHILGAL